MSALKVTEVFASLCDVEANMPIFHSRAFLENQWKKKNSITFHPSIRLCPLSSKLKDHPRVCCLDFFFPGTILWSWAQKFIFDTDASSSISLPSQTSEPPGIFYVDSSRYIYLVPEKGHIQPWRKWGGEPERRMEATAAKEIIKFASGQVDCHHQLITQIFHVRHCRRKVIFGLHSLILWP